MQASSFQIRAIQFKRQRLLPACRPGTDQQIKLGQQIPVPLFPQQADDMAQRAPLQTMTNGLPMQHGTKV
ncbi:hypothetical protein RY45_13860 [Aeromonas hydrophila]|nr:hypothetical protein RY45_13860 [Aeromonas hydrophila]